MPSATIPDTARRARCVACGKPATPAFMPFCGAGCRDRDLLEWLSDGHRIPGPSADGDEGEDAQANGLDSPDDHP